MDKYDEAVEYLTDHPDEIYDAWGCGAEDEDDQPYVHAQCLFQFATRNGEWSVDYGCLTQIRVGFGEVEVEDNHQLTLEIRADERIPSHGLDIRVEHLPVFAEWQRRLDRELGRST